MGEREGAPSGQRTIRPTDVRRFQEHTGIKDEQRIIADARTDREAFAPLYRAYVTPVYRYFLRHVGSAQDAEDLTATTFSKALDSLDRYEERGSFAAWLFSIARHTLLDQQRRRRPSIDGAVPIEVLPDPRLAPEAQLVRAERIHALHGLIGQLPSDQREALILRFFAGLRASQIAAVLGRSEGSARMLIHRAIVTLRDRYLHEEQP